MGEETQDDVCHILGEDDADEASETADEAEVDAEWDEPPALVEPAASSAGAAVAGAPSEFPPSRAGALSRFLALRIVYGNRSNDGRMMDQKKKQHHFQNHDFGNTTEVCLFIILLGNAKTEPAPTTINFGTALPQTRARMNLVFVCPQWKVDMMILGEVIELRGIEINMTTRPTMPRTAWKRQP